MTNPYTPPGAPVNDPPGAPRRSSLAAIGIGFAVDVVATLVFSTLLGVAAAALFGSGGESLVEIADRIDRSTGLQLIGLAGGLSCTALGGYVAARYANQSEYANGFAVGLVSLVFGEITIQFAAVPPEWWLHVVSAALVIPAALVGAHVRMQRKMVAAQ